MNGWNFWDDYNERNSDPTPPRPARPPKVFVPSSHEECQRLRLEQAEAARKAAQPAKVPR